VVVRHPFRPRRVNPAVVRVLYQDSGPGRDSATVWSWKPCPLRLQTPDVHQAITPRHRATCPRALGSAPERAEVRSASLGVFMFVPFQSASRRRHGGRSLGLAISLVVAFGLAGLYVNMPPLGPPGGNPQNGGQTKKCPKCGEPVDPIGLGYSCGNCGNKFKATDADDWH
jgi:hypothetical protein